MTATTARKTAPLPATPGGADLAAEQRGRTHIPDHVVERIATAAVDEVDTVVGSRRGVLGVPLGQREHAHVQAAIRGGRVVCEVRATLTYPSSVRDTARAIRTHVTERVESLTGLRVGVVDVVITGLTAQARPRVR